MRTPAWVEQPLPLSEQPRQRVLLDRFDLTTQFGERLAPDLAQDFGIAPLAMKTARTETALEYPAIDCELAQCIFDGRQIEPEAVSNFPLRKWTMGARIPAYQFEHGLLDSIDQ